jgi:hypothetical protein
MSKNSLRIPKGKLEAINRKTIQWPKGKGHKNTMVVQNTMLRTED